MLIAASVALTLGTLLTLAALLGARVRRVSGADAPGKIGWARWILRFVLSPFDPASWESALAIGQGLLVGFLSFGLVASIFSTGASLLVVGVGIVLIGIGVEAARIVAVVERRRVAVSGTPALHGHPYRSTSGGARDLAIGVFLDLNRWRDVAYVFVSFPLTIIEFAVAFSLWTAAVVAVSLPLWIGEVGGATAIAVGGWRVAAPYGDAVVLAIGLAGLVLLPVAASVSQGLLALHRAVVRGLLCESGERALQRRVETLEVSRRAVLDTEATELRRIERDLHDGAQQRLVMLAMGLGMAAEKIESDPERARSMVLEARDQARQALAELRDLVRGIAPSILMDRGLVAALESLTGRTPVPTAVLNELPPGLRLPDAIERAGYFVAAEALANVAKHAAGGAGDGIGGGDAATGARAAAGPRRRVTRCEVRLRREDERLVVEVWDDGPGGATMVAGSGLSGLADRVGALDGTFEIDSPVGGPTLIRATIPVPGWAPQRAAETPALR